MDEIKAWQAFSKSFNNTSDKIVSGICAMNCYNVFERYLRNVGVPDRIISDILSDFESWDEVYESRKRDQYSLPVNKVIGKVKGITNAVNNLIQMNLAELHKSDTKRERISTDA